MQIDELSTLEFSIALPIGRIVRPIMGKKAGKVGWIKGWDVIRMTVVDLGVKSAIHLCDPRTRLNARAGVTHGCLRLPMKL